MRTRRANSRKVQRCAGCRGRLCGRPGRHFRSRIDTAHAGIHAGVYIPCIPSRTNRESGRHGNKLDCTTRIDRGSGAREVDDCRSHKFFTPPSCQVVVANLRGIQISGRDGMIFVMASSEFPALWRTWAKSFNLSRSVKLLLARRSRSASTNDR